MSWMDIDDKLLDHPKFIRAVKRGGSDTVFLWLGLRQWVAQNLTDGFIPSDMVDEVRGPDGKRRVAALNVLKEVGLIDDADGGVMLHDYLQWSRSRDAILKQREANRLRQARSRGSHAVTDTATHANVTPSVTLPSPHLSSPHLSTPNESSARAPEVQEPQEPEPKLAICPLGLLEKAEKTGILGEFCEKYRSEAEPIREVIREFESYWTIGGGMGRKEANWMRKLREHLRRHCEKPGGLEAPGALEHAQRQPKRGRGGAPTALAEALPAPYHDAWKPPDWMKS